MTIHHAVAGAGFLASARRCIVTNLALASSQPAAFLTYSTLEDATAEIARELEIDPGDLLAVLKKEGLGLSR